MPEGDTIYRTAATLRSWLDGHVITDARSSFARVDLRLVIGQKVESVEAKAKHLLIRFSNGLTLHTHMKMTGAWHVYSSGDRWKKPDWQARVVLQCGKHIAVGFNIPVVELFETRRESGHQALANLGPDVLNDVVDLEAIRSRLLAIPSKTTIGEVLLDQRVVSGIGNIYRCETLFLGRINPWTPVGDLSPPQFESAIETASRLMKKAIIPGGGYQLRYVYDRAGQACRRCGEAIQSAQLGALPRTVYWCASCQV